MDTTDFQVDEFERRISAMCKGVKFADKIPDYRNAYILFITENQVALGDCRLTLTDTQMKRIYKHLITGKYTR